MQMLKLVIDQLKDIRGSRSYGMGPNRVFSLPDAVAGALLDHFFPQEKSQQLNLFVQPELMGTNSSDEDDEPDYGSNGMNGGNGHAHGALVGADICPSCGTVALVHEEGCKHCFNCGYSEC
jgi:ribonucleoside-diphosphate reductase alpha chain